MHMDTHEIDNALLRKQYLEQHKTLTSGQIREASGLVADVHRPQCPANRQQVLRIEDLLVTQELGPRPVRRIREIVCQLARGVPSTRGLRRVSPEERETRIGVTKGDHVAGDAPRAAANSRTCRGPSSFGPQSPSSN